MPTRRRVVDALATPLEPDLVRTIGAVDDRLDVLYRPDLLPPTRYPCDHRGLDSFTRNAEQRQQWEAMLAGAEILFSFPGATPEGLRAVVRSSPGLRWVQATAGGAGEQVQAAALTSDELQRVLITRAGGVHGGPLAEFAMFGILAFTNRLPRLLADTAARRWDHYPMAELSGQTLLVTGLGAIGTEVARLGAAFGMRVTGMNRSGSGDVPYVEQIHPTQSLAELLPDADAVVVTLPLTDQTHNMIDGAALGRMRTGAVLVNVGRGGVVDEPALIAALAAGRLGGAALDVFATEPLPPQSPLWDLPNVLISPTPRDCRYGRTSGSSPCSPTTCAAICAETSSSVASNPLRSAERRAEERAPQPGRVLRRPARPCSVDRPVPTPPRSAAAEQCGFAGGAPGPAVLCQRDGSAGPSATGTTLARPRRVDRRPNSLGDELDAVRPPPTQCVSAGGESGVRWCSSGASRSSSLRCS